MQPSHSIWAFGDRIGVPSGQSTGMQPQLLYVISPVGSTKDLVRMSDEDMTNSLQFTRINGEIYVLFQSTPVLFLSCLDLDSVSSLLSLPCGSFHAYFHVAFITLGANDLSLPGSIFLINHVNLPLAQSSCLIHFPNPSTEQEPSDAQCILIELGCWFIAFPSGPPPSERCECENRWVILGLQSNDLSWTC